MTAYLLAFLSYDGLGSPLWRLGVVVMACAALCLVVSGMIYGHRAEGGSLDTGEG